MRDMYVGDLAKDRMRARGALLSNAAKAAIGAAVFSVLAGTALACPVADDLATGIRFTGPDGTFVVHRRIAPDVVEIDYVAPDEPGFSRSTLVHGVYILSIANFDAAGLPIPDSSAQFDRAGKQSDLPVPSAGLSWTGSHDYVDGSGAYAETSMLTVGQPTTWALGPCTYTALSAAMTTEPEGGGTYTETMTYLPELGTAVFVAFDDPNGAGGYTYTQISVEGG